MGRLRVRPPLPMSSGGPFSAGDSGAPAAAAHVGVRPDAPPPLMQRRPTHVSPMHRLRSPWSASLAPRAASHRAASLVSLDGQSTDGAGRARRSASPSLSGVSLTSTGEPRAASPGLVVPSSDGAAAPGEAPEPIARPFLQLHTLRRLSELCQAHGTPTAVSVSGGLLAIGTQGGAVLVFDMSQRVRCVCTPGTAPITALNLSQDASYVGAGDAAGHVYLYDVLSAAAPARHVVPISRDALASGKVEGHLEGTTVTRLSFVGARKTAIVTADAHGFCFYHSLGRMLGMASNDTLRVYGHYAYAPLAIGDAAPLPLGPTSHAADEHRFVALLVPDKLLLIGLRPSARTWYRSAAPRAARATEGAAAALAWFPATAAHHPMLAFAFGRVLRLLHVRAVRVPSRARDETPLSAMMMDEEQLPPAPHAIARLQWVHRELLLVATAHEWLLLDFRTRAYTEWQPHDPLTVGDAATACATMCVWRSKVFLAAHGAVHIGDFVPWDARLAALEAAGTYDAAIAHALELYNGRALGSGIGLPETREAQRGAIAARIETIARAAAAAVGDAPALEPLARQCVAAAVATQRFGVLFHELYDAYEARGAESMLIYEVEQYVLRGQMPSPPAGVVQRLIEFRARLRDFAAVEQLVLHVGAWHLDLDQVLPLCARHGLWDALAYVCGEALDDAVTPVAAVLASIAVAPHEPPDSGSAPWWMAAGPADREAHAHAVFSILSAALRGLRYPSLAALPAEAARRTARSVAALVFSEDTYAVGGRHVVPHDAQGPLPYLRALLALDAEAFLDELDLAFETWLGDDGDGENKEPSPPTRRAVLDALLRVRDADGATLFIALFAARNAARYPQFVRLTADEAAWLFTALTSAAEPAADREFALECLLSAHPLVFDNARIAALEHVGFWRVYESALRRTQRHAALLVFYATDRDGTHHTPGQLYARLAELFSMRGLRSDVKRAPLADVLLTHIDEVPDSLLGDVARAVERFFPAHADEVRARLASTPRRAYLYLCPFFVLDGNALPAERPPALRSAWIALLAEFAPGALVAHLDAHERTYFDLDSVRRAAETHGALDAVLWALDRAGQTDAVWDAFEAQCTAVAAKIAALDCGNSRATTARALESARTVLQPLEAAVRMAVRLCIERGQAPGSTADASAAWFRLLRALVLFVHGLAPALSAAERLALEQGHTYTHEALSALVSSVPSETVSLAQLFRRLVGAADATHQYAEVRVIVDAMLAAYRLRCEVLRLGVRLSEADAARLFRELARERGLGWLIVSPVCAACGRRLDATSGRVLVGPLGAALHDACTRAELPRVA